MKRNADLPPGQYESVTFPRFGLASFANKFPKEIDRTRISIVGDVRHEITLEAELEGLRCVEQMSDFHCVTTWSHRGLRWSGFRFSEFYQQLVVPLALPSSGVDFVVLRGQDGYRSSLPLADLLASDVLLADRLNDEPLSIAHGAPLRLVAPAHYGYKSVKHIAQIEFRCGSVGYRASGFGRMSHPRARVAYEERGRWAPGRVLRYLYRPLVRPTTLLFELGLQRYLTSIGKGK